MLDFRNQRPYGQKKLDHSASAKGRGNWAGAYHNNYDNYYDSALCRTILKKNDLNKVSRILYHKMRDQDRYTPEATQRNEGWMFG